MSITRRVPPVQHQLVPVRIFEERHVADACVARLAVELDALRLELRASCGDVRNADRNARVAGDERRSRVEDVERNLAELELQVVLALGLDRQAERLGVE